ncbi:hypothetical protein D9M69_706210 [compost metagenome]
MKDATTCLVTVVATVAEALVLIFSCSQFSPEKEADSATLLSCACNCSISSWIFSRSLPTP